MWPQCSVWNNMPFVPYQNLDTWTRTQNLRVASMLNTCETKIVQKGHCSMLNACEARTIQIAKKLLCLFNHTFEKHLKERSHNLLWTSKQIQIARLMLRQRLMPPNTTPTKHIMGVSKCLLSMEEEDISETWTHNQLVLQLWEETGQASHPSEEEIRKGHWTCLEIYQNCWARVADTRDS